MKRRFSLVIILTLSIAGLVISSVSFADNISDESITLSRSELNAIYHDVYREIKKPIDIYDLQISTDQSGLAIFLWIERHQDNKIYLEQEARYNLDGSGDFDGYLMMSRNSNVIYEGEQFDILSVGLSSNDLFSYSTMASPL